MGHFSQKSSYFWPDCHSFQSIHTKFSEWMEGEVMEGGTRQWRVAEGGGGWHRMVEGGEREGNKSFMVVFLQQ